MQNSKIRLIISAALLLCGVLEPQIGWAVTYWVSPTGSDSNSCASVSGESDPGVYRRTIKQGIACMAGAGHTVVLKNGTYAETGGAFNNIPSGVSWLLPNVIKAQNSRRAIYKPLAGTTFGSQFLNKHFIRVEGIVIDHLNGNSSPLKVQNGSSDIEILDVEIKNSVSGSGIAVDKTSVRVQIADCSIHDIGGSPDGPGYHGFYIRGQFVTVERCKVYNVFGYGIQLYEETENASRNNIVRYSLFYNNGRTNPNRNGAIYAGSGGPHQIYGNVVYNNKLSGIILATNGHKVYNNTTYNNGGIGIDIRGGSNDVRNNISYGNAGTNLVNTGTGNILSANLTIDPQFVEPQTGNLRLKQGSPAIDKGATISIVATDPDGNARPQGTSYDIGAYEHTATTATLLIPPSNLLATPQ